MPSILKLKPSGEISKSVTYDIVLDRVRLGYGGGSSFSGSIDGWVSWIGELLSISTTDKDRRELTGDVRFTLRMDDLGDLGNLGDYTIG